MIELVTTDPVAKLWGKTRCIYASSEAAIFHATARAGGYSSLHMHVENFNGIYVVSGTLRVCVFDAQGTLCQDLTLTTGQQISIAPGARHRFEAETDVEMIETYWRAQLDPDDIRREGVEVCAPDPHVSAHDSGILLPNLERTQSSAFQQFEGQDGKLHDCRGH